MRRPQWIKLLLLLAALSLMMQLSGCDFLDLLEPSDRQFVEDLAWAWLEAKDMNPVNPDGSVDAEGVRNLGERAISGSTGDDESDAALKGVEVIQKINQADALSKQAWVDRDERYLDQAIALRPDDWTYWLDRGALVMDVYVFPKMDQVERDMDKAESLVGPNKDERIRYAQQGIQRMQAVKERWGRVFDGKSDLFSPDHGRECKLIFKQLAHYYQVLADQTGKKDWFQISAQYTTDAGQCKPPK